MKRYVLMCLSVTLCTLSAAGQTGRLYSPDEELSNSLVNGIYQDRKGFVWIATEEGLNRFDGNKFTIYKHSPDNPASLVDNYVRSMLEDSAGNFWVGSMSGLMRYDRATNSFRRVEMRREWRTVSPYVTCIMESQGGEIWLATSGMGLFVMRDGIAESVLTHSLGSNYLSTVFEDSKGRLWIGTENDGVFMYTPGKEELRSFSAPELISGNNISSIAEDSGGNIFVGTLTRGLNRYDEATGTFRQIPHRGGEQLFVKSLHVNRDNMLYVGTDGQGLKIYDAPGNRLEDYTINSAPYDFSKGKVHSILQDKDDNLWLGMFQKGVVLIPGTEKEFDYWGFKSLGDSPIGNNSVMSVFEDRSGVVWVGIDSEGLYAVNRRGRRLAHFVPDASPTSVSNVILSIYEDSRGDMWVGSYTKGLARFDRRTGRCEYIPELVNEKIYAINEDGRGNLLVGTYGAGFYTLGLGDGKLTHFGSTKKEDDDFGVDALTNDWISDILIDREGKIWLAHYKGVSCYDPGKKTFLNYFDQNAIIPGTIVYTLCEDREGRIWMGAYDGLYLFDKTDSSIRRFTSGDGLPNNVICGILEDSDGNMWISTYMGISKFDREAEKFINYYAGDGLQGNEFTRGACYGHSDGRMYFGGIYGVTSFRPDEITDMQKNIEVLITDFYINNHAVRVGDVSGRRRIVEAPVPDATEFTLSHSVGNFSIEFSALEYANPERIMYQYRIEELGPEWINSYRGVNRATYANLAPGTYTFSVRAEDRGNVSEPRTIGITITPPWYQSPLAYALYAILLVLFSYFLYLYARNRIRRRHTEMRRRHAEQINEAKLQFFINISHEIRTPMTLIINPLEKLISENLQDPALQKTYMMIHRNAQRILRLINQLMDIRKLDKGQMKLHFRRTDIVGFIEDLMHTFEYLAARKNISFNFIHRDEKLDVWIDLNNFDKVLLNILSNAFKYTSDGGNVTIELTRDETHFEISVTDSGIGIDESEIENIFERFYQINNELTNANFGTGIGMHLARSLVELHHGTIVAQNREETSGARFTVRLPLGNAHISTLELGEDPAGYMTEKPSPAALTFGELLPEPREGKTKPKTRYRVLVAEDENEIRDYISSELAPWFRISEAPDGKTALEMILAEGPDLVISDVMMPGMDGVTLVRKMKQNINISHIPVILLTAKSTPENRVEGLDVGADAYITKPFNTEVLRSTVANLIENRERLRNSFSGKGLPAEMLGKIELKSVDEQLMERVMNFINENLSNTDLSVEILASGVGMSRVHLHRRLKYLTGQSASDFIKGIRLRQAATLLGEGKFTISEVAYATGFSSLSHFSTSFRDFYGVSPTAYANKPPENKDNS